MRNIYDLVSDLLKAGERIQWVSFHPTILLQLERAGKRRVPYDQKMRTTTAREYMREIEHGEHCPKMRIKTTERTIFVSPSPMAQVIWDKGGFIEPVTLSPVEQTAEVTQ